MNPEQINERIAESLGWKNLNWNIYVGQSCLCGINPNGLSEIIPDYKNDLNSIHDVIKNLSDEEKLKYISSLFDLAVGGKINACEFFLQEMLIASEATALQRAIAYLKVKGLYGEKYEK